MTGSRRVPGLRREEVAALAGVSVDYYARLEQGRDLNVSEAVLDAVARALRLDDTEHAHLRTLASTSPRTRRRPQPRPQKVRAGTRQLLAAVEGVSPALVFGRRMDVLACNRLARALMTDFDAVPARERNMLRYTFLDPASRELWTDWDDVARDNVAVLRLYAGRHPEDPVLAELVGELSVKSEEFRTWWAAHDVRERSHGTKCYHHPLVGDLTLGYESLTLPGDTDQTLCIYSAEPGSPSADALGLLSTWIAHPRPSGPGGETGAPARADPRTNPGPSSVGDQDGSVTRE